MFTENSDGYNPSGALAVDPSGVIYGTTSNGGPAYGEGVLYRLLPDGTYTVLHSFDGNDGLYPSGVVLDHSGNIFGTTAEGSTADSQCGTIFEYSPSGTFTTIHDFNGKANGCSPTLSGIDAECEFFGFTGAPGLGNTLFKLRDQAPGFRLTTTWTFSDAQEGYDVNSLQVVGADAQLGTTYRGGALKGSKAGDGTLFSVANGTVTILHTFAKARITEGINPVSALQTTSGLILGATQSGGAEPNCGGTPGGSAPDACGTLFSYKP